MGIRRLRPSVETGVVTLNGSTPVIVEAKSFSEESSVVFTLKTAAGVVGAVPSIKTVTPGEGFTVAGSDLDNSTYNWIIL